LVPGDATSLPADFTIGTETGVFHHRLELLVDALSRQPAETE